VTRRTNTRTRLIGWSVLAAAAVVIVGIFLITRAVGPAAPTAVATTVSSSAPASEPSVPAASASSAPPSSAEPAASEPAASSASAPAASSSSSAELVVVDAAAMDQGARKALLNALIRQGVFTGVEAVGSPPKVGVTPLFQGLKPDLQRQFLAAVYTYVNNGPTGSLPLQVIDATTGKVVGNYTTADGLKLL
jgi:hypothetical protein